MPKKSEVTYEVDIMVGVDWVRILETTQLSHATSVIKFGDNEETHRIIKVTKQVLPSFLKKGKGK